MKRIDGTVALSNIPYGQTKGTADAYYAIKHDLKPAEYPAAKEHWRLHMPGQAIWPDYALTGVSLADIPGIKPAVKKFPEATHELILMAIDPDTSANDLQAGKFHTLSPVNYAHQVQTTDEKFSKMMEWLAIEFINGQLPAEPAGITINGKSAREYLAQRVEECLSNL